jgi:YidC/Oxa1 family membrane protein insertase
MVAFVGPKLLAQLDAVNFAGADAKLGDAVNYGWWEPIARPMLWVLMQIHRVVGNWGIAIIVITILLKLLLYYPNMRSMKSMKSMAALKPEMDRIKAKYGEDKNKQNQAVMELYKKHGINPLGGCLPMALQMPIYIAFYSMLSNAVQLYHASFVGPMNDMTAPFWPLAVVTGALTFLQQKFAPQSPDNQQQKMMMYMMPVMFMFFTILLPSGLTLYILTNTVLSMVQQWWFNRSHPDLTRPAPKPARA